MVQCLIGNIWNYIEIVMQPKLSFGQRPSTFLSPIWLGIRLLIWTMIRTNLKQGLFYKQVVWFIFTNVLFLFSNAFRRQFDLANKEAMDESAEWRLKYDVETERANKCLSELNMVLSFLPLFTFKIWFGAYYLCGCWGLSTFFITLNLCFQYDVALSTHLNYRSIFVLVGFKFNDGKLWIELYGLAAMI